MARRGVDEVNSFYEHAVFIPYLNKRIDCESASTKSKSVRREPVICYQDIGSRDTEVSSESGETSGQGHVMPLVQSKTVSA